MITKIIVLALSLSTSSALWAFTCYFTLAKSNCWIKYDVTVDVMDTATSKIVTSITVPSGQLWERQQFPCAPEQRFIYSAKFSPVFWASDKGKVYSAKTYWSLPNVVNPGDSAWNISVCYPLDFAQVPLPPEAGNTCECDFHSIPVIPPKKI